MRAILLGLGVLIAIAAIPALAPGQGYYDRLYRGVSPDPTDNRYDAQPADEARAEAERATRAARRRANDDEPVFKSPKIDRDSDDNCDSQRGSRDPRDTKC
jgi:hypothetical protein